MDINDFDAVKNLGKNYIAVRQGYKWGLLDCNLHILMRIAYDYISMENGQLWARFQGYKFYIPLDFLPMQYDCVYDFVEYAPGKRWAKVMQNGKYGVINQDFTLIIPCEFNYIDNIRGALWACEETEGCERNFSVYSYDGLFYANYDDGSGYGNIVWKKYIDGMTCYGIIDKQSREIVKSENKCITRISEDFESIQLYDIEKTTSVHFLFSENKGLIDVGYLFIKKAKLLDKTFIMGYRRMRTSEHVQSVRTVKSVS